MVGTSSSTPYEMSPPPRHYKQYGASSIKKGIKIQQKSIYSQIFGVSWTPDSKVKKFYGCSLENKGYQK